MRIVFKHLFGLIHSTYWLIGGLSAARLGTLAIALVITKARAIAIDIAMVIATIYLLFVVCLLFVCVVVFCLRFCK